MQKEARHTGSQPGSAGKPGVPHPGLFPTTISLNTAAVRVMQAAGGPRAAAAVAHRLGIEGALPDDFSLALGTGEVGLLDLCAAYAALLNGGYRVAPWGVERAEADRRPVPLPRPERARAVDAELAAMMREMLAAVVSRGSGRAAAVPGRAVAGKTGTTQDYREGWFVGAVGAPGGGAVIGVWLGNDDDRPMRGVSGGGLPARLFRDVASDVR